MEIIRIPFRFAEACARFASYLLDSAPAIYLNRNISAEYDLVYLVVLDIIWLYHSQAAVDFYAANAFFRVGDNYVFATKTTFFIYLESASGFQHNFSEIGSALESIVVYRRGYGRKRDFFNSAENTNKLTFIVAVQSAAGYHIICIPRSHDNLLYILAIIESVRFTEALQACRKVYLFNPRTREKVRDNIFKSF